MVRMGSEDRLTWVPGGIAELTTWMDDNLAVGSATRSHLHALQNATYVAQWTRSGEYEGTPGQSVVVRSGNAALGLRFAACDGELTTPRLIVERSRDHLYVGLRLVDYPDERELSELEYRRYAATIGAELRYAQQAAPILVCTGPATFMLV